jgi:hypothetical protein
MGSCIRGNKNERNIVVVTGSLPNPSTETLAPPGPLLSKEQQDANEHYYGGMIGLAYRQVRDAML